MVQRLEVEQRHVFEEEPENLPETGPQIRLNQAPGVELNGVFRFVLFCFSFCFGFGGPGGGFGGPGGGFLLNSLSSGFATTFATT